MRKAFDVYFRRGAAWRSLKYGGLCRRTCSGLRKSTIQTRNSSCIISERVDRHFIAREMEEMRRVGFLSCVLVERESGRCVGVLDHGQAARVRGRAACAFQCAPLSGCRGECLCTAYAAGGSSTLKKYVGNPKSEEDFLRIFLFLRICYFIQKIFYYDEKISEFR